MLGLLTSISNRHPTSSVPHCFFAKRDTAAGRHASVACRARHSRALRQVRRAPRTLPWNTPTARPAMVHTWCASDTGSRSMNRQHSRSYVKYARDTSMQRVCAARRAPAPRQGSASVHPAAARGRTTHLRGGVALPHAGHRRRPVQRGHSQRDGGQGVHDGHNAVAKVGAALGKQRETHDEKRSRPGCAVGRQLNQLGLHPRVHGARRARSKRAAQVSAAFSLKRSHPGAPSGPAQT